MQDTLCYWCELLQWSHLVASAPCWKHCSCGLSQKRLYVVSTHPVCLYTATCILTSTTLCRWVSLLPVMPEEGLYARRLAAAAASTSSNNKQHAGRPASSTAATASTAGSSTAAAGAAAEQTPLLAQQQQQQAGSRAGGEPTWNGQPMDHCWTCRVKRNLRSKHCPLCK